MGRYSANFPEFSQWTYELDQINEVVFDGGHFVSVTYQWVQKVDYSTLRVFASGNHEDNRRDAEAYMREMSSNLQRLAVGFGLDNGTVVVLPTEGYAYDGRRKTKDYVVSGDSFDTQKMNLIKSKGFAETFKVKVNGRWESISDVIISIPNVEKYHHPWGNDPSKVQKYEWLIPYPSWPDQARNLGADNLILLYKYPWKTEPERVPYKLR